ncbi:MAG: sigma-70 family RNA polymerase sigma factor [Clostridia bacterium]|nr:sigma-70 family RNA polymerase sigma factor [Clostridia bacterium]
MKERREGVLDFEKLYNACYLKVYSYALSLSKNAPLAEELTQQAFFKAMLSPSFRQASGEFTWLCAIVKNLYYDELRKNSKKGILPENRAAEEPGVEECVLEKETLLQIHLILHQLDEPYKEVFSLRVFGELSFKEISALFGKTESWARVTYHRARMKILEQLN